MTTRNRILVAEDNPMDAFILKRAVLRAGIDVPMDFVRDGQEAIDYLKGETPASESSIQPLPCLMLLDLKMPRLNGFDVLRWVREQKDLHRFVVVVLTSSAQREDVNRAYDLGANSYIVKPSEFTDLQKFAENLRSYWLETNQFPDCERQAEG